MDGQKIDPQKSFLGVGVGFPVRLTSEQTLESAIYEEDIRQAIRIILGTNPGDRLMRPDFGAGLDQFIFEPVNTATMAQVKTRVEEALIDWEPRMVLDEVKVSADPSERNSLLIEVQYRVRATDSRQNLVYPFYLEGK
jgi:phage baseplate assembly protein W